MATAIIRLFSWARSIQGFLHGPELQRIDTGHGIIELSIFEHDVPPRFRLVWLGGRSSAGGDASPIRRAAGCFHSPSAARSGSHSNKTPEPHSFDVTVTLDHGGQARSYRTSFSEEDHDHPDHDHGDGPSDDEDFDPRDDPLYAPATPGVAVLVRHPPRPPARPRGRSRPLARSRRRHIP